jgi:hypothetical protein
VEHKLILGGAQYLPFARSRIKALQRTGLPYASQRFTLPDATVSVRIEPGQEHIHITGGGGQIFSGVSRGGFLATVSTVLVLQTYKPTSQAWTYALAKDAAKFPLAFRDEAKLSVAINTNIAPTASGADGQMQHVFPSMYSGLMAKCVQTILGYGKLTAYGDTVNGVKVNYDWRWNRCHGIVTASDGKLWLVEISIAEGILAMPLPMYSAKIKGGASNKVDALAEAYRLFKGLPSGATFPTGTALTDAITDGAILRLLDTAAMADVHGKTTYAADMGWSFKLNGSEAHNTCCDLTSTTNPRGYHYKLAFLIGTTVSPRSPGTAIATASAVLTQEFDGLIARNIGVYHAQNASSPGDVAPMNFWDSATSAFKSVGTYGYYTPTVAYKTPVFVCHINDVLEKVYSEWRLDPAPVYGDVTFQGVTTTNANKSYIGGCYPGYCASSDRYAGFCAGIDQFYHNTVVADVNAGWYQASGNSGALQRTLQFSYGFLYEDDRWGTDRWAPTSAIWPKGARDCYQFFEPSRSYGFPALSPATSSRYTTAEAYVTSAEWDALPVLPANFGTAGPTRAASYSYDIPTSHLVMGTGLVIDEVIDDYYNTATPPYGPSATYGIPYECAWGRAHLITGFVYKAQYSVIGPNHQVVKTKTFNYVIVAPSYVTVNYAYGNEATGTMILAETPADIDYSFLGYI